MKIVIGNFMQMHMQMLFYYIAGSASGQDEATPVFWLAIRAGKMDLSLDPLCSRKSEILWCNLLGI